MASVPAKGHECVTVTTIGKPSQRFFRAQVMVHESGCLLILGEGNVLAAAFAHGTWKTVVTSATDTHERTP